MKNNILSKVIYFVFLCIFVACNKTPYLEQAETDIVLKDGTATAAIMGEGNPPPKLRLTQTSVITPVPQTAKQIQLTFTEDFTQNGKLYQGIYGMNVGCLNSDMLCLQEPQLLIKMMKKPDVFHGPFFSYTWSSDGNEIVGCASTPGKKYADIYVSTLGSDRWINLTESDNDILQCDPTWTHNEKSILYTECSIDRYGGCRLFEMDRNGGEITRLFPNLSIDQSRAKVTEDGNRIIFIGNEDGIDQIYVSNKDGSDLLKVTQGEETKSFPSLVSKEEILFEKTEGEEYNLFTTNVRDGSEKRITTHLSDFTTHAYAAPFGNWAAYVTHTDTETQINIINIKTGEKMVAKEVKGYESIPGWREVSPR